MATKKWKVQQMAEVWHEVWVEAKTKEEALELGMEKIMNFDGEELDDTFEFQDTTNVEEENEENRLG